MTKANVRLMEGTFMDKMKIHLLGYGKKLGLWFDCLNHSEPGTLPQDRAFLEGPFPLKQIAVARVREGFPRCPRAPQRGADCLFARAKHHDPRGTRGGKNSRGSRARNSQRRGPMASQHSGHDGNWAQAEGVVRLHGRRARRQHCRRYLATLSTCNRPHAMRPFPRSRDECRCAPESLRKHFIYPRVNGSPTERVC